MSGTLVAVDAAQQRFLVAPLDVGDQHLEAAVIRQSDVVSCDIEFGQ